MSHERIEQFQSDADALFKATSGASASKGKSADAASLAKQVKTLRTFLFKNQALRLTDSEREKLFSAVILLRKCSLELGDVGQSLPLVSDALKMPQNVFTAKHKGRLLKLYNDDAGVVNDGDAKELKPSNNNNNNNTRDVSVIDVDADDNVATVLLSDEPRQMRILNEELSAQIREFIDSGAECEVTVDLDEEVVLSLVGGAHQ
jgi:hypothetical protein